MSILSFNKEYDVVKDIELERVAEKMKKEQELMKKKNQKYLFEKEALKKYIISFR